MSNEFHTDYSCLARALWWAKDRGYKMPALEQAVFDGGDSDPLRASLRRWAQGLLFDHDFAKAVFGEDEVDEYGQDLMAIEIWAKQHAVEFEGKLIAVQGDRPSVTLLREQEDWLSGAITDAPTELAYPERVVMDLKKMVASVPFRTHHIDKVRVYGAMPSWKYHIREMAMATNPFIYVNDFIDQQIAQREVIEPNVV